MKLDGRAARVLGALDARQPLYAVLDGARDPRVRGWVKDTRAPAWCLFRKPPPPLEDVAPWLLRLVPGERYTAEFFTRAWGRSWGILLSSSAHSKDLRRHLRKFLVVRSEEGPRLVFRYYDPRVLRVYLPTCTPAELKTFFGPVSAMAAEAEEPGFFHLLRLSEGGLDHQILAEHENGV
jgi:hypothetical protein